MTTVSTWVGDRRGTLGAASLCPFVGVESVRVTVSILAFEVKRR